MIDIPTVFILGAGASVPYGYPSAAQLRLSIIRDFRHLYHSLLIDARIDDPTIASLLHQAQEFIDAFNRSSVESIDRFLSFSPSFTSIGKKAITLSMLHSEQKSVLREEMEPSGARQDWYKLLYNRMISELKEPSDFKKFRENKVAFITFNYDRSFDHFLYDSFLYTFSDSRREFEASIKEYIPFPIIHVYGQVDKIKLEGGLDYKANYDFTMVERLSRNIRVIGERTNDLNDKIIKIITDYKRIFFLGFGYADENMDSIVMPQSVDVGSEIYGTAYDKTPKEIEVVRDVFRRSFAKRKFSLRPQIENKTCYELLREYL